MPDAWRKPQPLVDGAWLLDDANVRRDATNCLRSGVPALEIAQVVGVCADTVCDMLGIGGRQTPE